MRHIKLVIFLAIVVIGGYVFMRTASNNPSVRGQDPNIETRATNTSGTPLVGTSGSTDSTGGFVAQAAEMSAAELALAQLAERNATSGDVKTFASALVRDHVAAGEELKALAARKGWGYPQSLDALQAQALQGLQQMRGPEFDRAFVDAMVTAHEKAVAAFTQAAASSSDPDLKAFAGKHLPALQNHLAHARELR